MRPRLPGAWLRCGCGDLTYSELVPTLVTGYERIRLCDGCTRLYLERPEVRELLLTAMVRDEEASGRQSEQLH